MSQNGPLNNLEIEFCKLFNDSIRSRILIRLITNFELKVSEFVLDDIRLKEYSNGPISKNTVKEHLGNLKKGGFVNFRKDGLYVYWSINEENLILNQFRKFFTPKEKRSKETAIEIQNYLSEFYHIHDIFKPSEFRTRLEQKSYIISSARLSQILKGLTQSGHLKKEERARYKIMKIFTEEESL